MRTPTQQELDLFSGALASTAESQTVEEVDGPELLTKLAQSSGGINYMISKVGEMQAAFGKVGVTLHNQYVLGYYPPENAPCGKYRKITVQVMEPIDLRERYGEDPDRERIYEDITSMMQGQLDELAAERRLPVLG